MRRPLTIGGLPLGPRPLVVAAGGEAELELLADADGADVVEVRADLFDDPRPDSAGCRRWTGSAPRAAPVLLTVRAGTEGGTPWPDDRRAALYAAGTAARRGRRRRDRLARPGRRADAARPRGRPPGYPLGARLPDARRPGTRCSHWSTARARWAPTCRSSPPTPPRSRTCVRSSTSRSPHATRGVVTLGMGPFGPLSRVVLPAAGSLLTYGRRAGPPRPASCPLAELARWLSRLLPA